MSGFDPSNHGPHKWPIGQAASWRDGYGCPTICCEGEGEQRRNERRASEHAELLRMTTPPPPEPTRKAHEGEG